MTTWLFLMVSDAFPCVEYSHAFLCGRVQQIPGSHAPDTAGFSQHFLVCPHILVLFPLLTSIKPFLMAYTMISF